MASQFNLLKTRRFLPLFISQFLGAFNNNVFKNSLIMLIVFNLASENSALWVNLASGLFILPFFIFASLSGQVSEKYDKAKVLKYTKFSEMVVMSLGGLSLFSGSPLFMVFVLFLMGIQASFFGPCKYSIIPEHVKEEDLIGANGLIEMGTFLAILIGTMTGAYFIVQNNGTMIVTSIIVACSVVGYIATLFIPNAPSSSPDVKISWNIVGETKNLFKIMFNSPRSVYLSVIGISWFWFLGATYLVQLPSFVKDYLNGSETIVTLMLVVFSVGIALGSLLCEHLSRKRIELGIVPFGSIGITLFGILLYYSIPEKSSTHHDTISMFLSSQSNIFVVINMFMIGMFGGFYTVPLYALIQKRTDKKNMSRLIAVNNMLNALFMVLNAAIVVGLFALGLTIPEVFLVVSIFSAFVSLYIYQQVPEFFIRFVIWMLSHSIYRVKHNNIDNLPEEGGCVIVSNHVSFIDGLLLGGAFKRPIRFVMYDPIYRSPFLNWFFRLVKAIPIDSKDKNPVVYEKAFQEIETLLKNGEIICIFPEGKLTSDGSIGEFKKGIEKIIKTTPVPVLPCAIVGMWGSLFSRKNKIKYPRPKWSKVTINVGNIVENENCTAIYLEQKVKELFDKN